MQYKILIADHEELEQEVNNRLQLGWEPLGGVSIAQSYDVTEDRHYYSYAQAMIHRSEAE